MKIMLDTNICIYLIKQRPQALLNRFRSFPVGDIGISVITLAELQYGASKSSQPKKNREALEQFLSCSWTPGPLPGNRKTRATPLDQGFHLYRGQPISPGPILAGL